jgi:NAD-dependent deacetylase
MAAADPTLVGLLREAGDILVFSGAGISTGSGIADYRGPSGVWKTKQPVYFNEFMTDHSARVEYWDQKLETWPGMRDAVPNATHHAVARLEDAGKVLMVVTQNIDGLHSRAGTSPARLVELHGTLLEVECMSCHQMSGAGPHMDRFEADRQPPVCDECGGYLKPATISFGQSLRNEDLSRAIAAAQQTDLVLALGSTLSVHPASSIPLLAVERGARYVIINRGVTEQDGLAGVTLRLEGDVSEILPPAVEEMLKP